MSSDAPAVEPVVSGSAVEQYRPVVGGPIPVDPVVSSLAEEFFGASRSALSAVRVDEVASVSAAHGGNGVTKGVDPVGAGQSQKLVAFARIIVDLVVAAVAANRIGVGNTFRVFLRRSENVVVPLGTDDQVVAESAFGDAVRALADVDPVVAGTGARLAQALAGPYDLDACVGADGAVGLADHRDLVAGDPGDILEAELDLLVVPLDDLVDLLAEAFRRRCIGRAGRACEQQEQGGHQGAG